MHGEYNVKILWDVTSRRLVESFKRFLTNLVPHSLVSRNHVYQSVCSESCEKYRNSLFEQNVELLVMLNLVVHIVTTGL
jgi:hypothetical protein